MYTTLQAILAINPEAKATVHTPHDGSAETIDWLEGTAEISQKDIDEDVRYGLRFMQSENGGHADVGVKWRNIDDEGSTKKKYKWKVKKWLRWRWLWKFSWAREAYTVNVWQWLPAEYVSLADPGNYKFNRIAFGAYDPLEATHKKAKGHKTINKYELSLEEIL